MGVPFVEFGLRFREACAPAPSVLVGYANGWVGYVPTRAAFEQGGYGVDFYADDPPAYARTMIEPGAGERMLEAMVALGR